MIVNLLPIAGRRRFTITFSSRRGLLAAATSGLLTARQLAEGSNDAAAKKKGKRKKKRKSNRRKKERTEIRVDAVCPGPTDNAGLGLLQDEKLAQTFTALNSGRLVRAELLVFVSAIGSTDLTLQLRDIDASGVPTDEVLAETTVASSDLPTGESVVNFSFADSPAVAANREYALVLSMRGASGSVWMAHRGNSCDGRAFRSNSNGEPFAQPPPDDLDLIFTTLVTS
jgi:hypothetical protein